MRENRKAGCRALPMKITGGFAILLVSCLSHAAGTAVPPARNLERDLIRRSGRPLNYETPVQDLRALHTPARKLFVRSHLPNTAENEPSRWQIALEGEGFEKPMVLSLESLRRDFKAVEVPAVLMCAGNRRSEFQPRVPGVQWGRGAIGNGVWKGVRLRYVLEKAGVRSSTVEVEFNGADFPALPATPDFIKSIPLSKALDPSTLLAFEYNGEPLPRENGHPVRLVVPGWVASYWVKQVVSIRALSRPSDNFWMQKAYRIDKGRFPEVEKGFASQETATSAPITEMVLHSMITNPQDGMKVKPGRELRIEGFAWDGGRGITKVEVSIDGGRSWVDARLGAQPGNFSWRPFSHAFRPERGHSYPLMARATNSSGQVQPPTPVHNGAGYHNNATTPITVEAR